MTSQRTNKFGFTAVYQDGTTMPYRFPTQQAADLAAKGFQMDPRVTQVREIRPEDPVFLPASEPAADTSPDLIPLASIETGGSRSLPVIGRDVCAAARAARQTSQITYLTTDGERIAMIMPLPGKAKGTS